MLGEGQSPKRGKGKAMKKGRTLRLIVVFLSGLLATTTSVYAAHFAAAGVKSHITSGTEVQFWFLGVSSPTFELEPVIPTQFQCTVVHNGESKSFQLSAFTKEIAPFTVVTSGPPEGIDTITMTGTLLSQIVFVSNEVQSFIEIIPFKAVGVDVALPGEGQDTFDLELEYSTKGIGPLLLEALGSDLVKCDEGKDTCILKLANKVEKGEIEGHTASGD
jgi:hypothetical protein